MMECDGVESDGVDFMHGSRALVSYDLILSLVNFVCTHLRRISIIYQSLTARRHFLHWELIGVYGTGTGTGTGTNTSTGTGVSVDAVLCSIHTRGAKRVVFLPCYCMYCQRRTELSLNRIITLTGAGLGTGTGTGTCTGTGGCILCIHCIVFCTELRTVRIWFMEC